MNVKSFSTPLWHKVLSVVVAVVLVLGLAPIVPAATSVAYADENTGGGERQVLNIPGEKDANGDPEPLSVATEALDDAVLGEPYTFQLEAGGTFPDGLTWEKVSGPSWVTVSEDGVVSGTNTASYWSSGANVKVKVTNEKGESAEKTLKLRSLYKYKKANGTVYASVTKDGKFLTSDGEDSGTLLNYVPVSLADVAKVDLDAYGLADYKLASDRTGNYAYEVSYLQLMLYMHENYAASKADGFATGAWSSPGSLWVSEFWGVEGAYFTYGLNGEILVDEQGGMPTADTVALKSGDECAMNFYADSSWYGDSNTADYYFKADGKPLHEAEAFTGVEASFDLVKVFTSRMNPDDPADWSMQSDDAPAANIPVGFGKAYDVNEAAGELKTGEDGTVKVTFPEAGTYYLWADGIPGAENPNCIVSAPAMLTVTVTDQVAPEITTSELPVAVPGMAYEAQLEAEGNPADFSWSLALGAQLPAGLELSEDGAITGTPAEVGDYSFAVLASNGVEPAAQKELTIQVKKKHPELEGEVYVSVSEDGDFLVSDGAVAGTTMWQVPVKLADLAAVDLSEFGLERFYLPAEDPEADYAYEVTALQLMAYAVKSYCADPASISTTTRSTPRHVFFNEYFGLEGTDWMYNYNGTYPWDETLGEGEGATADAIVLADGDTFNIWHFTNSYASVWYSNGVHEFVDAEGNVARSYETAAGKPVEVAATRTGIDYKTGQPGVTVPESGIITTPRRDPTPYPISYGRSYGEAMGETTLDAQGKAELTFDEPGEYYVWLEGSYVDAMDFYESSPAMAKVVVRGAPVVKTLELPDATAMTEYSAPLEAASAFPVTWFVEDSDELPAGLSVSEDGIVSGTPTEPGIYTFKVFAFNDDGSSDTVEVKIKVLGEAPSIGTTALPEGMAGEAYEFEISVAGLPAPEVTVEGLPEGLAYDAETGKISGTAAAGGAYTVTIKASNGLTPDAEEQMELVLYEAPSITTEALPDAIVDIAYENAIETAGHPDPVVYVAGSVPGLTFGKDGKITGTPTEEGTYTVKAVAKNSEGSSQMKTYTLTVNKPTDKTELEKAIEDAKAAEKDVAESTTGKDVPEGKKYTTPEEKKALDDAIAAAQKVADDPNATQAQADEAAEAVKAATEAYDKAKKNGTMAALKSATAPNQVYTGKALKPALTVKDANGKTVPASAYTVSYANNTKAGTATATATAKKDSGYSGTVKATFQIKGWKRLWGSNALKTMEQITKEYGTAKTAVVATNADFKDSLAAAALAGSLGAPMLTTSKGALSAETKSELNRMGVTTVYIVGTTSEVSAAVESQIKAQTKAKTVKRIAAATASERAVAAAKQVKGRSDTVIIATQNNFKDALAVSPYAYASKSPILYAEANKKLSNATLAYIKSAKFKKAIIVGGPVALPKDIETQLKGAGVAANSITRLAGSNQYKTAQVIAEWAVGKLKNGTGGSGLYQYASIKFQPAVKMSANNLGVARADDNKIGWKDALAGAALCGKNKAVLLLADAKNSAQAEAFIKANKAQINMGYVFGGKLAVPEDVMAKLEKASL